MTDFRIGWVPLHVDAVIKQGSAGGLAFVVLATKDEQGTPLDSYDGWTASLCMRRRLRGRAEIRIVPAVVPDPDNKQFVVTVTFRPADTENCAAGILNGDVCMLSPGGDWYYPADITLTIECSVSAPA